MPPSRSTPERRASISAAPARIAPDPIAATPSRGAASGNGESSPRGSRPRSAPAKGRGAAPARQLRPAKAPPILVRQLRGDVVESIHRGSIVQVGADGTVMRELGDPSVLVNLRSAAKPFGLVAFVEAGGIEEFDLSPAEIAVMAGSHSGEDLHVRTLQGVYRRAGISQQLLGCGSDGAPLDELTAARLARDGEKPGPMRHMCSGQHTAILLLCKLHDWPLNEYWRPEHPVQRVYRATVARAFAARPESLVVSTDACGIPTYAFPLNEVARAFALLGDPAAVPASDPRAGLRRPLTRIRDAMLANPDMVAGSRGRIDTSVMKALPGRIVAKGGAEGLRAFAMLPAAGAPASGIALKIEDGAGFDRAVSAATVETLRQVGTLDAPALRALGRYARPAATDPRGVPIAEAVPDFELAPVGELLG